MNLVESPGSRVVLFRLCVGLLALLEFSAARAAERILFTPATLPSRGLKQAARLLKRKARAERAFLAGGHMECRTTIYDGGRNPLCSFTWRLKVRGRPISPSTRYEASFEPHECVWTGFRPAASEWAGGDGPVVFQLEFASVLEELSRRGVRKVVLEASPAALHTRFLDRDTAGRLQPCTPRTDLRGRFTVLAAAHVLGMLRAVAPASMAFLQARRSGSRRRGRSAGRRSWLLHWRTGLNEAGKDSTWLCLRMAHPFLLPYNLLNPGTRESFVENPPFANLRRWYSSDVWELLAPSDGGTTGSFSWSLTSVAPSPRRTMLPRAQVRMGGETARVWWNDGSFTSETFLGKGGGERTRR